MTEPRKPSSGVWIQGPEHTYPSPLGGLARALVFDSLEGIRVLSSIDFAEDDSGDGRPKPQFHISVSMLGRVAGRDAVRRVLRDFGMQGAFEDNHVAGGIARNFWLPVEASSRAECSCIHTEAPHDDGNEYVWRDDPHVR